MSIEVVELERAVDALPGGWRRSALAGVADISRGTSWGSENEHRDPIDGALPVLGIRNVQARLEINDLVWLHGLKPSAIASSTVQMGDILMVGSNGNPARIGNAVQVDEPGRYLYASLLFGLRPRRDTVDPDFLYYAIVAPGVQAAISDAVQGTTGLSNLKITTLRDLPIDLPPLDEQRRIAEVLRSVDEAIVANAALLNGVKATKQGTMEAVLSGGFDEVRLETLLADTRYPMRSGPFGSALLKSELQPDGIPFLGIDNVHVERFVPVYRRFISEEKYRELSRYTVYPGDVMVTIMGTVGRCCVVPPDVGTAISSKHVWTLTIDHDRYSPALLAWQINHSPAVLEQLQGSAQGGIMSAISSGTLRDLLVPLPSPAEVREIENLLLSFNAQIAALEAELDEVNTLKAAVMSDLLSGRMRVPA